MSEVDSGLWIVYEEQESGGDEVVSNTLQAQVCQTLYQEPNSPNIRCYLWTLSAQGKQ